jgi:hypothetical protein
LATYIDSFFHAHAKTNERENRSGEKKKFSAAAPAAGGCSPFARASFCACSARFHQFAREKPQETTRDVYHQVLQIRGSSFF